MSAEAPKETGTAAPIPPQKPEGGFLVSLRRFFEVSARIVQSPPGVEGFAANIQQAVDIYLTPQRQSELDEIRRKREESLKETERIAAEVEQSARVKQEISLWRSEAIKETTAVLTDFRVKEKMLIINKNQWGGRGRIEVIGPSDYPLRNGQRCLGGLSLVYNYLSPREESGVRLDWGHTSYRSRWVYKRVPTKLWVGVLGMTEFIDGNWRISERRISVESHFNDSHGGSYMSRGFQMKEREDETTTASVPVDDKDSSVLFDEALIKETIYRISQGGLPSQLEDDSKGYTNGTWGYWRHSEDRCSAEHPSD